jgi:hypothetical protein
MRKHIGRVGFKRIYGINHNLSLITKSDISELRGSGGGIRKQQEIWILENRGEGKKYAGSSKRNKLWK